jgi:hypothetical protein
MEYKRNQIEEAISAVLEPRLREPSTVLQTRLKRLLETDRSHGRTPRSTDPERANYAFYGADPPGSGVEVWFSGYEAFAILTGLRLFDHGWPQTFAVSMMRRIRPELETEHTRILKQDAQKLFDQDEIRRNAKEGDMAFDVTDPVLLVIVSKSGVAPNEEVDANVCAVCRGPNEAMKFLWQEAKGTNAGTMFELVSVAHRLAQALSQTEPTRRGRGA